MLKSASNGVVFLCVAMFFLLTIEGRLKRRKALHSLISSSLSTVNEVETLVTGLSVRKNLAEDHPTHRTEKTQSLPYITNAAEEMH